MNGSFTAECSCGWTLSRDADAANLPRENNKRIADAGVGAHEFAHEFKGDGHSAERGWSENHRNPDGRITNPKS